MQEIQHPQPDIVRSEVLSSFTLCNRVYKAYQRQMLLIPASATQDVVRKLVECTMDGIDPTLKATQTTVEETG